MWRKSGIIVIAAALGAGAAAAAPQDDAATFDGYRGDTRIYSDRITTGKGRIEDRIEGIGRTPDREAVTLPGTVTGEIYTETENGVQRHSVVVKGDFVNTYDGQGMTGMIALDDPPLVFDSECPSHYGMLLARYDRARGGAQKITVIVPEKGDYWKVEITPRPAASIPFGEEKKETKVYQYRVDFNQYATVWILDDAVAAVYLPWKDEYIVDARYPMLQQKIQMLVKRSI